jgi:alkaline phosphatase
MLYRKLSAKRLAALAAILAAVVLIGAGPAPAAAGAKNVIVLIVDGCSAEQYTLARWFKGAPLAFDPYQVGAIRTYIADSVVADSASAASAYSTGVRTNDGFLSMGPNQNTLSVVPPPPEDRCYKPMATILEGAKLLKKATGLVATSSVTDATPAAFMAHTPSRRNENDIMEQAAHQIIDVVFGGGKGYLMVKESNGLRLDGDNLYEYLKNWGYQIVETRDKMMGVASGRVFGMFSASDMDPEIDRPRRHPDQPTLEDMTRKAIELLSQDNNGFFLMVEGSQVDWACHANDPAYLLSELLNFDKAVMAALEFARKDRSTLVLVMSDHNTGGFSIGNYMTSGLYSQMKVDQLLAPFRKMKASSLDMWGQIEKQKNPGQVKAVIKEGWAIDITDEDALKILTLAQSYKGSPHFAIGEVLCSKYTYAGWTTHGHTGGDVPLFAFGPGKPSGVLDAPDIARVCAAAMGFDLEKLNRRLFVEAGQAFGDGRVAVDTSDPANPVVKIAAGGKTAELPVNKNLLRLGQKMHALEGVVVYAPNTGKAYIPLQAVNLIKGSGQPLPEISD